MLKISRGSQVLGTINDSFALSTQDVALNKLYSGWLNSGIVVLAPAASSNDVLADNVEIVKPSAKTEGVVIRALEREGYTVT